MFWKVLGLLLGVGVAAGPFEAGREPSSRVSEALFRVAFDATDRLMALAGLAEGSRFRDACAVIIGVCTPGVVALGLVAASGLAGRARNLVAVASLTGAILLVALYGAAAVPVAGLLLASSVLLGFATGLLVVVPVTALATIVAVAHGRLLLAATQVGSPVSAAAAQLAQITGTNEPSLWRIALVVTAAAPLVYGAQTVLRAGN